MMIGAEKDIEAYLRNEGIFGPDTEETRLYESRLTRFFEREYVRYRDSDLVPSDYGVPTDEGPIMEETEALMEQHYDEQQDFFSGFLDTQYRAYSMAYYGDLPEDVRKSSATLEDAQEAKFALSAKRAGIQGDEKIFNIGCGFGSLETYLLKHFPALEIVSITPSKVQLAHIRDRMQDPSDPLCTDRLTLIEGAFDQLDVEALGGRHYDLVISVAVFEQVINMQAVLEKIASLLLPGGRTFHHFITSQAAIPQFLDPDKTRIGLYFPGGRVWPHAEFAGYTDHFDLSNIWFVNGLNYWRTLDEWHHRYWRSLSALYQTTFDHEQIGHWNNYFSLCKAMFAPMEGQFYGNSHYLFSLKS
jgi:cyclopropane-fatty-acyl-phospholipid synthase